MLVMKNIINVNEKNEKYETIEDVVRVLTKDEILKTISCRI